MSVQIFAFVDGVKMEVQMSDNLHSLDYYYMDGSQRTDFSTVVDEGQYEKELADAFDVIEKFMKMTITDDLPKVAEPIVEEKEGCCICFEPTENKTACNHIVCVACITKLTKKVCPLCRTTFPKKPKPPQYFTRFCPIEVQRLRAIKRIGILQKELKEFESQVRLLYFYGEGGIDFERESVMPRNDACRYYKQICEERIEFLREKRRRH